MSRSVLIVDDHPAFRDSARSLLKADGFDVVGDAEDGASAIAAAERLRPDVVLLDIQLPDIDGFEVARRLMDLPVRPVVVLTSTRDARDYGDRLEQAPAKGFISKAELSGLTIAELVAAET